MPRFQYSQHPFDMNEYLSGMRSVIGGMACDWEDPEEPLPVKEAKVLDEEDPLAQSEA